MTLNLADELSASEREVRELARRLGRELAPSAARHDRERSFPHAHYRRLHEAGYLRLALPREFGGAGASLFEMVLAQEQLARGDGATAVAVAMLLNLVGPQAEETRWPRVPWQHVATTIAREGGLANAVVTEPALGSVSRGGVPETVAVPEGAGWRISGRKSFVTGAPALRFLLTAVRLPPTPAAPLGETARALVEAPAEGLTIHPTWHDSLAQRSGGSDDVVFDRVFVRDEFVIDRQPIGDAPAPPPPPGGWWLTVVAAYLGIGQGALDAALRYAEERVPSALGRPLATLPHVRQWLGQMQAELFGARAALHAVARRWVREPQRREALAPQVAAAKALVTNAVCRATETGLRVAGGFALTAEAGLERPFRDARGGLFMPPQDDQAYALLAQGALAARAAEEEELR